MKNKNNFNKRMFGNRILHNNNNGDICIEIDVMFIFILTLHTLYYI